MRIEELRRAVPGEEVDYRTLISSLREYVNPRAKVATWIRRGDLVRVKKGLYVFGPLHSRRPASRELLANLIYGPSYVSLDSALQIHGFIPEKVEAVTSVACGRSRRFTTPLGVFIYRCAPPNAFAVGVDRSEQEGSPPFLLATPEKALADKVHDDRGSALLNRSDMLAYLKENLRIPEQRLAELSSDSVEEIAQAYRSQKLRLLARCVGNTQ